MSSLFYLANFAFELARDVCSACNKKLHRRPSSAPFISGDTYRSLADFLYDETELCSAESINAFTTSRGFPGRKHPLVFVSSWKLEGFEKDVLPKVKTPFVMITHQGDVNITNTAKYKKLVDSPMIIHWFAQNCVLKSEKVTPLPIGLEDLWRHNAGATADFKNKSYINRQKKPRILYGFSINTNPEKRAPCYISLCRNPNADEVYRSPTAHIYRRRLSKYMFVASPAGNGFDCHRTWEALYLGVVPIVEDNTMNRYFKNLGLPIKCIKSDDWDMLSKMDEKKLADEYNALWQNIDKSKLFLNYWAEQFNSFLK